MNNIVIFGASGHGSVVVDCAEKEGKYKVVGFIDSSRQKGDKHCNYEILGDEKDLPQLTEKFNLIGGIVAIGDNWIRKKMVDKILSESPNFNFVSIIHPLAYIGKNVKLGNGVVVMPGSIVNADCQIGDFCILNTNSSIDHGSIMENYSSIAPSVCIGGNLVLKTFSAICLGANVIGNITIEEHTVIGAGSLVVNDIESHKVSYGTPAQIVRSRKVGEPYLNKAVPI